MIRPICIAFALALPILPANSAAPADPGDEAGPPGMVEIKKARATIGSDKKDIVALIEANMNAKNSVRPLDAETPQFKQEVPTFFLGLNEMTNEQYRPFVMATGHRPPILWGGEAVDAARQAHLEEVGRASAEARAQGKRYDRPTFDAEKWWSANWTESRWEVPPDALLKPVVTVNYADVLAYCKWAGVRLPTEFEYQRACRGTGKQLYPWGDEFEAGKHAATNEIRGKADTFDVGSFTDGATEDGVHDLSGNVWEWTSSPYIAYEKFKKNTYKFGSGSGREQITPEPTWDANQRVVVGGSYQNGKIAARCTSRRPTDRTQMTNAMGFRIAASPEVGVDVAEAIYRSDVALSDARGTGVDYRPDRAIAWDRWEHEASASPKAVDGYSIITNYEYLVFVPIEQLEDSQDISFAKTTWEAPQHLGFLTTNQPMIEPALPAGTYLIAFRAKGEARAQAAADEDAAAGGDQDAEAVVVEDPLAGLIDTKIDNIILWNAVTAEFVMALPATGMTFGKGSGGGDFFVFDKKVWIKDDEGEDVQITEKWIQLKAEILSPVSKRVLPLKIDFKPEPSLIEKEWRRSK